VFKVQYINGFKKESLVRNTTSRARVLLSCVCTPTVNKLASEERYKSTAENKSRKENIIFNIHICQSNTILVVLKGDLIA